MISSNAGHEGAGDAGAISSPPAERDADSTLVATTDTPEQQQRRRSSGESDGNEFVMNINSQMQQHDSRPQSCPLQSCEHNANDDTGAREAELLLMYQQLLIKSRDFERQANDKIDDLEQQNAELISQKNAKVSELNEILTQQQSKLESFEHTLREFTDDKEKGTAFIQEEMTLHATEVEGYRQRIECLEAELHSWEMGKQAVLGKPSTAEAALQTDIPQEDLPVMQVIEMAQAVSPSLAVMADKMDAFERTVDTQLQTLMQRVHCLNAQRLLPLANRLAVADKEKQVLQCERDSLMDQLNDLKTSKVQLEAQVSALNTHISCRDDQKHIVNRLRDELDAERSETKQLLCENARVSAELQLQQDKLRQCSDELDWYKQKHTTYNTEQLMATQARVVAERDALQDQVQQMQREHDQTVNRLSQQIVDCEHVTSLCEREKTAVVTQLHSALEQVSQLQDEHANLQREHEALQDNARLAAESHQTNEDAARTENERLNAELQDAEAQLAASQQTLTDLQLQHDELKQQLQRGAGGSSDEVDSVISSWLPKSPVSARQKRDTHTESATVDARVAVGSRHDQIRVLGEAFALYSQQDFVKSAPLHVTAGQLTECAGKWLRHVLSMQQWDTQHMAQSIAQLHFVLYDALMAHRARSPTKSPGRQQHNHELNESAGSSGAVDEHNCSLRTDLAEAQRTLDDQNMTLRQQLNTIQDLNLQLKRAHEERTEMTRTIEQLKEKIEQYTTSDDVKDTLMRQANSTLKEVCEQLDIERTRGTRLHEDNLRLFEQGERLRRQIADLQKQLSMGFAEAQMAQRLHKEVKQLRRSDMRLRKQLQEISSVVLEVTSALQDGSPRMTEVHRLLAEPLAKVTAAVDARSDTGSNFGCTTVFSGAESASESSQSTLTAPSLKAGSAAVLGNATAAHKSITCDNTVLFAGKENRAPSTISGVSSPGLRPVGQHQPVLDMNDSYLDYTPVKHTAQD